MSLTRHLDRIERKIAEAADMNDALAAVAGYIRHALAADAVMVYLSENGEGRLTLRGSSRSRQVPARSPLTLEAAAMAHRIAQRREPAHAGDLQAIDAGEPDRPALRPAGTLAGAPVIHYGATRGVIVAGSAHPGHFDDERREFLVTVAACLGGALAGAMIRESLDDALGAGSDQGRIFQGVAGAPGIGAGHLVIVGGEPLEAIGDQVPEDPQAEVAAVGEAVARFRAELENLHARTPVGEPGSEARAIFDVYHQLLGDAGLLDEIAARILDGNWAPGALRQVILEKAAVFERIEDPYLRARAEDFREIGRRLLRHLERAQGTARTYPEACVLAGDEVGIVQLAEVPRDRLVGLVSLRGSVLSHTAVLARAMNIPAVLGLADLPLSRVDGHEVIVDGYHGRLCVAPAAALRARYRRLARDRDAVHAGIEAAREGPAYTSDGARIVVHAQAGMVTDMSASREPHVEGIGLYRTELAFMLRSSFPSEEEQTAMYREVLEALAPRPVTMRTLDAGGDKALPYFTVEERNPFLGWRGIRMSLDHPDIFLTQLRAMLTANVAIGNLRIMFPMVASIGELEQALRFLEQARQELTEEGMAIPATRVGVMIEVPSAAFLIRGLARRVDFVSIGTNDLVQYLLAVDRDNPRVANRFDPLHPAVVRALHYICEGARVESRPIAVCGEMAGEVEAIPLLLGLGVEELSVSPGRLAVVKATVRATSRKAARALVARVLKLETAAEVRAALRAEIERRGLTHLTAQAMPDATRPVPLPAV